MTPEGMAHLHAATMTVPRPWTAAEFAGLLALPGCFALGDGRVMALGRVTLDEAELLTLATDPDHRRQGLARALLDRFHDRSRAMGATRALLEVAADNVPAQALYTAAGYRPEGRRKGYYACGVDALLMARALHAF